MSEAFAAAITDARNAAHSSIEALHTKPALRISVPSAVLFRAIASPLAEGAVERESARGVALALAASLALDDPAHVVISAESATYQWERHSAFAGLTYVCEMEDAGSFSELHFGDQARAWERIAQGELVTSAEVILAPKSAELPSPAEVAAVCGSDEYVGSTVMDGSATVWTDLRPHRNGTMRWLVLSHSLDTQRAGRLVQRLLDIQAYTAVALSALPVTGHAEVELDRLEGAARSITSTLPSLALQNERAAALERLLQLSGQLQALMAEVVPRLTASLAFGAIVEERLAELREARIPGRPTLAEYVGRRFRPAMRTVENTRRRLFEFEALLGRSAELLRTAVEVSIDQGNALLLHSMDRRARVQLQLQRAVEGLSVVALTYYALGIASYALAGSQKAGWLLTVPPWLVALATPAVLLTVWLLVRAHKAAWRNEDGPVVAHQRKAADRMG